jgi:hypothetical protein
MLFALQVRQVAPSRFLPVDAELVHLVGAALALRALHLQGSTAATPSTPSACSGSRRR